MFLPTFFVFAMSFCSAIPQYLFHSESIDYKDMGEAAIVAELIAITSSDSDPIHLIARFDQPVDNITQASLANQGLMVQHPLGGSTYVVALEPKYLNISGVMSEINIKEIMSFQPRWKLHKFLADGFVPHWTMEESNYRVNQDNPTVALYVMMHQEVDLDIASEDFASHYRAKVRSSVEANKVLVLEMPYSKIDLLIEEDRVLYVEPALPKFNELNNSNRSITQADEAQAAPYNLNGEGVVVMVYDGGFALDSHSDFGGRLTVRDSAGLSDHATHVSGTIGGDGSINPLYTGMAPAATIESYGFEQEGGLSEGFLYTDPGDLAEDYGDAINNHGAVLANNSIGTNTAWNGFPCEWTGNYGITSNLIDSVVRGDLGGEIRIIWANGNERGTSNCGNAYVSTAPPACAKNHITVGAINSNDESMTSFSSWGPTDDGRIKPDISAPGCQSNDDGGVTSCSSSGGYNSKCGTSMASPTVTGISALIMQDWRNQFPLADDMRSSTLKALLAHTAEDKFNVGPDNQYGYGSVRVVHAIDHMRAENFAEREISHGETLEMLVYVQEQSDVKVTIAWDDVPATPLVLPSLVNDIDLTLIDPNGNVCFPWTLDQANPGEPAIQTRADHVNNIEQVHIAKASPGVYRIQINGYSIAKGPQEFGLMASPMLIQCSSSGLVSLDRALYACDATIGLQVVDCDLNTDDEAIETVEAFLASSSGDSISVILVENAPATAAFEASVVLGQDIQATEGDELTLTYVDADDGQGGSNVDVTDSAIVDCTTPEIKSVSVSEVLTREASIVLSTNELTQANVYFGLDCDELNDSASSNQMLSIHEVRLTGLLDNTTYYFAVEAVDGAGNTIMEDNSGNCFTFTTADIPDFFTEQFTSGNDLDGYSVTFTPYDNVDGYRACAAPITALPTDPAEGAIVSLSDDDSELRSIPNGLDVWLYGEPHNQFYICSNGRVTFGSGSTDYTESIGDHFSYAGVSMLFDDLNPSNGGTVRYATLMNRVAVTFDDVPEYSNTGSNTFQCEFFFDGRIRLSWLGIDSSDNIVGLSAGDGTPQDFFATDLSGADDCGNPAVPGDVNGDGLANVSDILAIMDAWGTCDGCPADLNNDGIVNVSDLLIVIANWSV